MSRAKPWRTIGWSSTTNTLLFLLVAPFRLIACSLLLGAPGLAGFARRGSRCVRHREPAHHSCSPRMFAPDFQISANDPGPVIHNVQAYSGVGRGRSLD